MNRIIGVLAVVMVLVSCTRTAGDEDSLPNILILYADDMGYGDMACQNPASKIPTPNLDQLAAEGMRFSDAHSSSGICTPSRYALLTGRHHWRKFHGIVNAFGSPVFDQERLTMAKMLQEKGYQTACIGKWHLGWNWDDIRIPGTETRKVELNGKSREVYTVENFDWSRTISGGPLDQGFDYYFGDDVINFPPYTWIENNRVIDSPNALFLKGREDAPEGSWECRPGPIREGWDFYEVLPTLAAKAVEFITSNRADDQPFFLYMAFPSPHAPIIPHDEFRGKTEAGAYGDYVFQTDWCVGQILEALSEQGLDENTLVVFSSDNGPEHYAYPRVKNFDHYSMGDLRGVKRDIWEGGHRVPFVIKWPGVVSKGSINETCISQVDLMSTFAEIIDFELGSEEAEDSFSLIPLLDRSGGGAYEREVSVQNTFHGKYSVRKGDWLLVDYKTGNMNRPVPDFFDSIKRYESHLLPGELYNLREDMEQRNNLYADHPEIVDELKDAMAKVKGVGFVDPEK